MVDIPLSSPSAATGPRAPRAPRFPRAALGGFLLLLAAMFCVSYAVGAGVGPVAPGLHGTRDGDGGPERAPGTDGGADDMPGMTHGHGG